jgi:ER lumen protein retaining receptor
MADGITTTLAHHHHHLHHDSHHKHHAHFHFGNLTTHSWNVFRYVGDSLHLIGIAVLLATIAKNRSVAGISRSTQVLYFLVFVTRYLDLFDHSQTFYLVFFKLTYIASSVIVLVLFNQLDATYERRLDTCNLAVIVVPCIVGALLLTNEFSALETLWTFSEFVEGFAMVPQYIFCYRERQGRDWGTSLYVVSLGGYRVFYAMNWIYKKIQMPHYSDMQSWIGGIIEIVFFFDFLNYRFTGNSFLRTMVLSVDTKINELSDKVEMKVLGSSSAVRAEKAEGSEMRRRRKVDDERPMEDV